MTNYLLLLCTLSALTLTAQQTHTAFTPADEVWTDTDGNHINAHGGGILLDGDTYYWFGEHKVAGSGGNKAMVGVGVYSSTDLYNWKNEGIALKMLEDTSSMLQVGSVVERPKVIYNDSSGKYVMWFHHELKGQGYKAALVGTATADRVTGPYTYHTSVRINPGVHPRNLPHWRLRALGVLLDQAEEEKLGHKELGEIGAFSLRDHERGQMSRDMTLFKDDDGTAYHITSSEENQTLLVSRLSDDYLTLTDEYYRVLPGERNEAPAIFKQDGRYYMISSGLTGWAPNPARSAVADSLFGPWTDLGNPVRGSEEETETTFHSQSTYILPVAGQPDAFIFLADRWKPKNPIDGAYIWLPLEFEEGKPVLRWRDRWDLGVFAGGVGE